MSRDLFADDELMRTTIVADGVVLLHGFAYELAQAILDQVEEITAVSPLRQMSTPSGVMSVAISNCGQWGWTSDQHGYRYVALDPLRNQPWPALPTLLIDLAQRAAAAAGYDDFAPNACLINRYAPGAKMALHQDKDEGDFSAPIVSISLGLPATFVWGGLQRNDPTLKLALTHGDVLVFGGKARLNYHGVQTIKDGFYPVTNHHRINLTLRRVQLDAKTRHDPTT
jgi:alkylated DNA repair protein (DNA oxidative demethylase)